MENIHEVETPLGPIVVTAKGRDEVCIDTTIRYDAAGEVPLLINRVPHRLWANFWMSEEGKLTRCRTGAGGAPEYAEGIHLRRNDRVLKDEPSEAAVRAIQEKVLPAVEAFLRAHPEVLTAGEVARRRKLLEGRRSSIEEYRAKIERAQAEMALLEAQLSAITEGREVPTDGERCATCFGPLTRTRCGFDAEGSYRVHCKTCGRESRVL